MIEYELITKILNSEPSKNILNPISKEIGKDLLKIYCTAVSPIKLLTLGSETLAPYFREYFENIFHKLGEKLTNIPKESITTPDESLVLKIFRDLEYEKLDNNIVSEILLEILANSMNRENQKEVDDYSKYLHVIKGLYPKSLHYLYEIHQHESLINQKINWFYKKNGEHIYGKDNGPSGASMLNTKLKDVEYFLDTENKVIINGTEKSEALRYTDDLQSNNLISNFEIQKKKVTKKLYFQLEGRIYCGGNFCVFQQYKYQLLDLGSILVDKFYSKDVVDIINKNA